MEMTVEERIEGLAETAKAADLELAGGVDALEGAIQKLTIVVTMLSLVLHAAEKRIKALDGNGSFDNDPDVAAFQSVMDDALGDE